VLGVDADADLASGEDVGGQDNAPAEADRSGGADDAARPRRLGAALWTSGPPRAPVGRASCEGVAVRDASKRGTSCPGNVICHPEPSLYDAECKMRDPCALDHLGALKHDRLGV
jgi:hypothetical protein